MSEVLSQSEIDALISSMASGASNETPKKEEQKYKKYDFHSPKKFTKDKLKIILGIYENYARLASARINSIIRTPTQVEVVAVEEQRYYEFSNALIGENDVITLINVKMPDNSINGPVVMHIEIQLVLAMIDRLLGGIDEETSNVPATYIYTDVELALYNNIVKYLVSIMGDGWANFMRLSFDIGKVETNPAMMQKIDRDETIIIVVLNVDVAGIIGKINICIPGDLLSNIFKLFEQKPIKNQEEDSSKEIMENIKETQMEIKAELGNSQLFLKDLFGLQVGDVINLNKPKDSDVLLYIEGEPWFKGELGKSNKNMAVKINDICEKI